MELEFAQGGKHGVALKTLDFLFLVRKDLLGKRKVNQTVLAIQVAYVV